MASTKILAIDIGTKMGWAFRDENGAIKSGTAHFPNLLHEGTRFLNFRRWLTELKARVGHIDHVYYEKVVAHLGDSAGHVYGGFHAILAAWCRHHDIEIKGIHVGTIKKHAAGTGRADKDQMIAAMEAKGFKPKDDNEADALALLFCAEGKNA